jgi:urease gamma subunit
LSGDPSRTAAEVAAEAGAEVIRKMRVPDGVVALATDVQIEALTAAGNTVRRHADLAEGRAERLAEAAC